MRQVLECGHAVWQPHHKNISIEVEDVQRRATTLLVSMKNKLYSQRLRVLGLPTLLHRRNRGDIDLVECLTALVSSSARPKRTDFIVSTHTSQAKMKNFWLIFGLTGILVNGENAGLQFSLNRNAHELPDDGSACAILFCQVKAHISGQGDSQDEQEKSSPSFSTISSLTIFQNEPSSNGGNGPREQTPIASVRTKKTRFQQAEDGIKGYGHLEPGYAMLRLQFKRSADCESEFTCRVKGVDSEGKEHVSTAQLLQQPKRHISPEEHMQSLSTSVTVQLLSLVQQITVKMALVERSQQGLDDQMNVLEHRLEDKLDAGFKKIEDKLCDLESKACDSGSDLSVPHVETVSNLENNKTLHSILDATKRIENALSNKSLFSLHANNTTGQACEQVLQFLAENLTAEINEFSNDREDLARALEDHMTGLTDNLSTILQSLEASLNQSLSTVPEFPTEVISALGGLLGTTSGPPKECKRTKGEALKQVVEIEPSEGSVLDVPYLCDMASDGGGWIIIQRRSTGDTDFYLGWDDYKEGFGTLEDDFWLGNDNIHKLTSKGSWELNVELKYKGNTQYANYKNFSIDDEGGKYKLHVGAYDGTAGDSLSRHDGHPFTTKDRDNDSGDSRNCAETFEGAWWYINCHDSNLNGRWMSTEAHHGLMWRSMTSDKSATFSEMKIRQTSP
ncbi:tenascin-R [Elysia marginata]|uniref:Tenascin-R n=1 Tax=Elysia marginata TaxID=1093978 RepID=A0AAV4JJA6_9GAST|nr:tenascin-R [Elysia marginata]